MRKKVQNRMAEDGESVNMTSYLGVSFHSDKKRECKRMGKRRPLCMESDHSHTAYHIRMPQPQAVYAYGRPMRYPAKMEKHVNGRG